MELVKIINDQPVTSSLQVAEVFEIRHGDVLESIRDLQEDVKKTVNLENGNFRSVDTSMFYEDFYKSEGSKRKYPMYYMNKDGWTLLVMGYRGKKATQFKLQYITQFNRMEEEIKNQSQKTLPQNYAQALRQLAEQVEVNETLVLENKRLKQANNVVSVQTELLPERLYTTSELAEELGYSSAVMLNRELHKQRIMYPFKKTRRWKLYAPYQDKGFLRGTKNDIPKWTEKGREFVKVRCAKNDIA